MPPSLFQDMKILLRMLMPDTFSFVMKTTLDGRQYRCMVTDGAARAYSEPAVITIAE